MKLEKVHRDKIVHIAQKMMNGNNQIPFVDNHSSKYKQTLPQNIPSMISHLGKQMTGRIIQKKRNTILAMKCIQMNNDFEGILEDKPGRKKEHHVLVYGTEDAREQQRGDDQHPAISPNIPTGFKEKQKEQPLGWATKGFYTVDRYNNYTWRDFPKKLCLSVCGTMITPYFSIFNPLYLKNRPTDDQIKAHLAAFKDEQHYDNDNDSSEVTKYQDELLKHPSYSPIKTLRESKEFVKEKEPVGSQTLNQRDNGITEEEKEEAKSRFELQTRRACKFGLEYMAQKQKTRSEMGEIAFLSSVHGNQADGANKVEPTDSKFILEKTKTGNRPGGASSSERVPITTSEQRKLFRIRSGNIGIRFYDSDGKLIKAPWNRDGINKDGWHQYECRRREKYERLAGRLGISKKGTLDELKKRVAEELKKHYAGKTLSEMIWLYNKEEK